MDTQELPPAPPERASQDGAIVQADLPAELVVALYENMVLARRVDEALVTLQREGVVSQHASAVGEEAAIVGAAAAMGDEDWIFASSREAAAALWRGMPVSAYAHHALGTARDPGEGRGAPDPPFWRAARVASVSPLAATQIPHAVGVAWAARLRGERAASLVYFGEGATSAGDFHAGLNFAGVTKAPVVALCRNNGLALSTPVERQTKSAGFAVKAVAYGLRGVRVDGGDVLAVLVAVQEARRRALEGEGATLLEAVIPPAGVGDPLERLRTHLEGRGLWSPEREAALAAEIGQDVERAIAEARAAEPPARSSLFEQVYAVPPWHLRAQKGAPW